MKLIKQSYEIWEQDVSGKPLRGIITSPETIHESLIQGIYKHIERAGRVCYKSEDKITEGTAEPFVQRMIESHHTAMLEHGTVYLTIPCSEFKDWSEFIDTVYGSSPYVVCNTDECDWRKKKGNVYITTNLRVIVENNLLEDLDYLTIPEPDHHAMRRTVHFTTNRQVTHELVRHRVMSFAQESTRYCNYMKGKFGSELTFIEPCWLARDPKEPLLIEDPQYAEAEEAMKTCFEEIEAAYCTLIAAGWKPQQAATVLPNAIKAEIVVTGLESDWAHIFDLRVKGVTGAPHPQMLEAMSPVYGEFVKRGWTV